MLSSSFLRAFVRRFTVAIYDQGKKINFNRLRVVFNNAYRRILDLPLRCCASGMYGTCGMYNLEAILRKQTIGFIGRLYKSWNTIAQTLENAWIIRIQLWHT